MRNYTETPKGTRLLSYQGLQRALVALSALVLLQGCKTMEHRAQAFGEGLMRAAEMNRQNREDHQRLVEWQNTHNNVGAPLPMRPAAPQTVIQQGPRNPAYTPNPSQEFLNQGLYSRPQY